GDRPIRPVSLDDEPAAARPRVAAELRDLTANQERRIVAEPVKAERDHRGGRRLPMRAGDHDRALERDELGQESDAGPALDLVAIRGRKDNLAPALWLDRLGGELYRSPPNRRH